MTILENTSSLYTHYANTTDLIGDFFTGLFQFGTYIINIFQYLFNIVVFFFSHLSLLFVIIQVFFIFIAITSRQEQDNSRALHMLKSYMTSNFNLGKSIYYLFKSLLQITIQAVQAIGGLIPFT